MKMDIVKIKSFPNGLNIVLDGSAPFEEILSALHRKFGDSASFFKNAKKAVKFSGRYISDDEENQLVDAIADACDIDICCILKENPDDNRVYLKAMEQFANAAKASRGQFFKGTLRSGQVLESDYTIIVLGDVNAGARVVSGANVIILGTLYGEVHAGAKRSTENDELLIEGIDSSDDSENSGSYFAAALDMKHPVISIGENTLDIKGKIPRKGLLSKAYALIAYERDNDIEVKEITSEFLNKLPF